MLCLECPSEIEPPRRYRNEYGQLLEHAPYCERDIRPPNEMAPNLETGDFVVDVKTRGRVTAYHYTHHPADEVGWVVGVVVGRHTSARLHVEDFEPITGRVHQPPPVHL